MQTSWNICFISYSSWAEKKYNSAGLVLCLWICLKNGNSQLLNAIPSSRRKNWKIPIVILPSFSFLCTSFHIFFSTIKLGSIQSLKLLMNKICISILAQTILFTLFLVLIFAFPETGPANGWGWSLWRSGLYIILLRYFFLLHILTLLFDKFDKKQDEKQKENTKIAVYEFENP